MFQWLRIRFKHFGIQTKYQIEYNVGNNTWTDLQWIRNSCIDFIQKRTRIKRLWYISCVENCLSRIDFAVNVLFQLLACIFNDWINYFDLREWIIIKVGDLDLLPLLQDICSNKVIIHPQGCVHGRQFVSNLFPLCICDDEWVSFEKWIHIAVYLIIQSD